MVINIVLMRSSTLFSPIRTTVLDRGSMCRPSFNAMQSRTLLRTDCASKGFARKNVAPSSTARRTKASCTSADIIIHYKRRRAAFARRLFQHPEAIQLWHYNIKKNHIRRQLFYHAQRLGAVAGLSDHAYILLPLKYLSERTANLSVVIYNENPGLLLFHTDKPLSIQPYIGKSFFVRV